MIINEKVTTTIIEQDYDVVIIGGGVAGCSAALSSAREKKRVLLIENSSLLGGLATAGLVMIYLPLCDGLGSQVSYGIAEELLHLSLLNGPYSIPSAWPNGSKEDKCKQRLKSRFNPNSFALNLTRLLVDEGVDIFFNSKAVSIIKDDEAQSIQYLVIENKEGRFAISSKFYIDCTGDADIAFFANEELETRTDNRKSSWYISGSSKELKLNMIHESIEKPISKNSRGYSGSSMNDIIDFITNSHLTILNDLNTFTIKQPLTIPSIPQFRMTRRLIGQKTLSGKDINLNCENSIGIVSDWTKPGYFYSIPYTSLYGKTPNLLLAGRCISATDQAWNITRSIPGCAVSGEGAGLIASILIDEKMTSVHNLTYPSLQKRLIKRKIKLKHSIF